jgi:HTH-type transcriptional regulator, osmoprotectant uptake regulator
MPRRPLAPPAVSPDGSPNPVARARRALLEGVGAEVAASFPGITRLGGQIVAALYLADGPQSMDALAAELGCSKSNIFGNLRGLEHAGIVERRREAGARHDTYGLRGPYPDVIIGAYVTKLRRVVGDKVALADRSLELLGDAQGPEADALRKRLVDLRRKYALFGEFFARVMPAIEGPIDLERLLDRVPSGLIDALARLARDAMRAVWTPSKTDGADRPED